MKTIYTIGHSTRSIEEFVSVLNSFSIKALVDIRTYPGSSRYPHFNKENLQDTLHKHGIDYHHLPQLGGRRKPLKDSKNIAWKNDAFRGYADHMDSEEFKEGIEMLNEISGKESTAYMCSEAVWWRCHRALVSDYLKWKGWRVEHIMSANKSEEHPYTSPAKIINGELKYAIDQTELF